MYQLPGRKLFGWTLSLVYTLVCTISGRALSGWAQQEQRYGWPVKCKQKQTTNKQTETETLLDECSGASGGRREESMQVLQVFSFLGHSFLFLGPPSTSPSPIDREFNNLSLTQVFTWLLTQRSVVQRPKESQKNLKLKGTYGQQVPRDPNRIRSRTNGIPSLYRILPRK